MQFLEIQNFRVSEVLKIWNLESQNFNLRCGWTRIDLPSPTPQSHKGYINDTISKSSDWCKSVFSALKYLPYFSFPSIAFIDGKFEVSKFLDRKWPSYDRVSRTQTDRLSHFLKYSVFHHSWSLEFCRIYVQILLHVV